MKTPDVKECPCCGIATSRIGPVETVEPICEQVQDSAGKLAACQLYWRCRLCGCRWMHGQFDTPTKRTQTREWQQGMLDAAHLVEDNWNCSTDMVNAKQQAERFAAAIRANVADAVKATE